MKTTERRDREEELTRGTRDELKGHIVEQVVQLLGKPEHLLGVQVRWVGSDRCRANVFVGEDVISGRIAHSFYLTIDGEGNILTSSPSVARLY